MHLKRGEAYHLLLRHFYLMHHLANRVLVPHPLKYPSYCSVGVRMKIQSTAAVVMCLVGMKHWLLVCRLIKKSIRVKIITIHAHFH